MKLFHFEAHKIFRIVLTILLLLIVGESLRVPSHPYISVSIHDKGSSTADELHVSPKAGEREELGMELYPTGSSLPDCSHACGPCSPCKRVVVSFFKCSVESCPIVYRCMCKGKYYHVPSA